MPSKKTQDSKAVEVLEGEVITLTKEEKKIIDDSVAFINEKWNSSCRNLIDIGLHLLKNFYNDDPELAKARGRKKEGISLRKLAIRPDLNVSIATLSRAFNLAAQEKVLADVTSPKLTDSHKILLLHIEDPEEKTNYAKNIVADSISCRDFTKLLINDGFMKQRGLVEGAKKQIKSTLSDPLDPFMEPIHSLIKVKINNLDLTKFDKTKSKAIVKSLKRAETVIGILLTVIERASR